MPAHDVAMPQMLLLCCPACSRQSRLTKADGLPPGVCRLVALCPACEGHGADTALLEFDDGCIVRDEAFVCAATHFDPSALSMKTISIEQTMEMSARG